MSDLNNIPEGWSETVLNDVCSKITDGSHQSPKAFDSGFPMLSVKDMKEFGFDIVGSKRISKEDYDFLVKQGCQPEIDDVLIAKDGSVLKHIFRIKEKLDVVLLSSIAIIRPNQDEIDSSFLVYILTNPIFKKYILNNFLSGSGVPRIVLKDFKKIIFNLPPLPEQKSIADILTSFDEKIELLQVQNKTLEAIAQTIFKEWFGKYQIGDELPEGWRIGTVGELIEKTIDNRGKTPPLVTNENKYLMLETYQMNRKTPFPNFANKEKMKFISKDTYQNWFRSGHPQYLDILFATVGNGIPNWCFMPKNNGYCIAQNLVAFRAKKEVGNIFLKYFFDSHYFRYMCNGIIITTAQPSIKLSHLRLMEIIIPDINLIKKYNERVRPMVEKIFINHSSIQTLTKTRDTLLPKLMSGAVRV